jgi:hypothetical protein
MSSNLEVKLNITNYNPHPENPNYTVFHFYRVDLSGEFEKLLNENNIPFEKAVEQRDRTIYLYGIKNAYYKEAVRLNFLTYGKFRDPFIPNRFLGFTLIIIVFIMIVIALIGFMKS